MKMRWFAVVLLAGSTGLAHVASSGAQDDAPAVTVFKSATCREDITTIKTQYGVPDSAASCHTALVGGYVVEGHVPAGMPAGAPGMEVPSGRVDPYDVVGFDKTGRINVFEKH